MRPYVLGMNPLLFTDRYQLTMLAAYFREGLHDRKAVFELFVRDLPGSRRYMVACGIARAVEMIGKLGVDSHDMEEFLADDVLGPVLKANPNMVDFLYAFHWRGQIYAMPEGTVCFPGEPMVRVEGTLAECQMIETLLLSVINHDTRVASKCSRIARAAKGRPVWEFGTRRTHERAAVDAARAAYIAGFAGTSNEAAHRKYRIPVSGTMAHSYILAHAADHGDEGEAVAFAQYAATFGSATCLVDTYDTIRGVDRAMDVVDDLRAVRIDSGDLAARARQARKQLDEANPLGRGPGKIMLSDDLDEYKIQALLNDEVPVDLFGVGTMAVSTPDAPSLGAVYKLVAIEDAEGRMVAVQKKGSKGSSAGPKQVWRTYFKEGGFADEVTLADEKREGAKPLLVNVRDVQEDWGTGHSSLLKARARLQGQLDHFPSLCRLESREYPFPVTRSLKLQQLSAEVESKGSAEIKA